MLKVSSNDIRFRCKDKHKNITLTNQLEQAVIYKVKTNNIEVIQAKPNCGFIKPNSSVSLMIKSLKSADFEAKLQIIYATIDSNLQIQNQQNFQTEWSSIQKHSLKYHLILVKRSQESNTNSFNSMVQIGEAHNTIQGTDPNLHKKTEEGLLKRSLKTSGIDRQLLDQKQQLQRSLQTEKGRISKLRQQLEITEDKLKDLTDNQIQMKINRSMGAVCEQHHTSFTTLVMIGLFCLVIGFCLGKAG